MARAQTTQPVFRIAVVGMVHNHLHGFMRQLAQHKDVAVVGFSEPDEKVRNKYAKQYKLDSALLFADTETMLEKTHPQAVVVYSSTLDHLPAVEACAKRGVHVMMEKPLATTLEDAKEIARLAREANIHVLVNYETTWYASNWAVEEIVRAGSIGDIRKIVVHDGHQGPALIHVDPEFFAWLTNPKQNGAGALFDFGCYGANLATWLLNNERPLTVTAVTQHLQPKLYPKVDDEATIIVTYPTAQAIFQASWNWPYSRKDMEVYGQTGYAITQNGTDLRVKLPKGEEQKQTGKARPSPYDGSLAELRAVVMENATEDPLTSLENNLIVVEILDAARESAATGKTIQLPEQSPFSAR
jgi:predicted dehydrogenase